MTPEEHVRAGHYPGCGCEVEIAYRPPIDVIAQFFEYLLANRWRPGCDGQMLQWTEIYESRAVFARFLAEKCRNGFETTYDGMEGPYEKWRLRPKAGLTINDVAVPRRDWFYLENPLPRLPYG